MGTEVLRAGEIIEYYHPFWGWKGKSTMATILKVDVDDPFPLRLDTRDALDRTHEIRHVAKFIDGEDELQHCIENEWNKIGTYQLEAGHVKNYHKRKSLEAQQLERIQCGLTMH